MPDNIDIQQEGENRVVSRGGVNINQLERILEKRHGRKKDEEEMKEGDEGEEGDEEEEAVKKKMGRPKTTDEEYKSRGLTCIACGSFRIQKKSKGRVKCMDCGQWYSKGIKTGIEETTPPIPIKTEKQKNPKMKKEEKTMEGTAEVELENRILWKIIDRLLEKRGGDGGAACDGSIH